MGAGESMDIFKEGELENSAIFKDQSSMDYVSTGYDSGGVMGRVGVEIGVEGSAFSRLCHRDAAT